MNHLQEFEHYRPLLFSIAYRMLGSAMEAEDILQEAFLRYQSMPFAEIQAHKSFLTTVVARLCLDHLKSAQAQREQYIGPWLPEPILTGKDAPGHDPDSDLIRDETISIAFLFLLEQLSPPERAVFILREAFHYSYPEIAAILDKEEDACRQLLSRAKKRLHEGRPRFQYSREEHERILNSFLLAAQEGKIEQLQNLLAEEVVVWSDGGGKVAAATRPIHGRERVFQFFAGLYRQAPPDFGMKIINANGRPAMALLEGETIIGVLTLEIGEGQIRVFHIVRNPDKLRVRTNC